MEFISNKDIDRIFHRKVLTEKSPRLLVSRNDNISPKKFIVEYQPLYFRNIYKKFIVEYQPLYFRNITISYKDNIFDDFYVIFIENWMDKNLGEISIVHKSVCTVIKKHV